MRLSQQELSVRLQLRGSTQQRRDVVYELRHQTRVRVIRLAVVIRHHLRTHTPTQTHSDLVYVNRCSSSPLIRVVLEFQFDVSSLPRCPYSGGYHV